MHGNSFRSNTGRFSNVSVNFSQPEKNLSSQQQQNQQQGLQPSHMQSQQQYLALQNSGSSTMFGSEPIAQNAGNQEPAWFNNPKKRAIPQTIVKRIVKDSESSESTLINTRKQTPSMTAGSGSLTSSSSGFDSMSFGSKRSPSLFNGSGNQTNGFSNNGHGNMMMDTNDAPPTVSLQDWQREDEFGVILPNNGFGNSIQSTMNNDNGSFTAYQASASNSKPFGTSSNTDNINTSNFSSSNAFDINRFQGFSSYRSNLINDENTDKNLQENTIEFAVIVFGYPESISNSIITHFSKFGNILEDFQVLRSPSGINISTLRSKLDTSKPERKYPIFTGDGWVKLTYDTQASAARALQENGVVLAGAMIGCVPYTKATVEQLASCKIEKINDIGGFNVTPNLVQFTANAQNTTGNLDSRLNSNAKSSNGSTFTGDVNATRTANGMDKEEKLKDQAASPIFNAHKLKIQDGKSLFVHNAKPNNHNFLRSLETKMRQQEELSLNQKQPQTAGVLHSVNNWLFGWNDL